MDKEEEKQLRLSNWTETVEDLVTAGDTDAAISVLQSVISDIQTSDNRNPVFRLPAALYSSKGFSPKAGDIAAKALVLKQKAQDFSSAGYAKIVKEDRPSPTNVSLSISDSVDEASVRTGNLDHMKESPDNALRCNGSLDDDDSEAIADCPSTELLSLQRELCEPELSVKETKHQTTRQRGRRTFSWKKRELCSDELSDSSTINHMNGEDAFQVLEGEDTSQVLEGEDTSQVLEGEDTSQVLEGCRELKSAQYGTQHVLVLADLPLGTRTIDLERLIGNMNSGVAIRWVNDTVALVVFQTPSAALEALNHVRSHFTVRILDENDTLLSSISPSDLEPPKQRPKTDVRTARRLIAQGLGLKFPPSTAAFGSKELRRQEENRRNRFV